jgi:hypothetical protein
MRLLNNLKDYHFQILFNLAVLYLRLFRKEVRVYNDLMLNHINHKTYVSKYV